MKLAVLCPGQGAQHPALLDFVDRHADSAAIIADASAALDEDLRACLASGDAMFRNAIAQPLIAAAQLAQWAALRDALPMPAALAGYSIGELACYAIAGAFDASELVRLARARAEAMDTAAAATPGSLVGVSGLTQSSLRKVCAEIDAHVAIVISDDTAVVGGTLAALDRLRERCANLGVNVTELRVDIASHTPLLASAAAAFRGALERSTLSTPSIPVVAGVDASLVATRDRAIETLSAQISHAVEWAQCLDTLHERGCRVFIELGPGRALSRMVRARFADVEARAVDEFRQLENVSAWVQRRLG
jgi:[acyl-carrier-protein] S-malonyltransferase